MLMFETNSMTTNFLTRTFCWLALFVLVQDLNAQQTIFIWSGTGETNNWSEAGNWVDQNVPTSGITTDVIFTDPTFEPTAFQDLGSPFVVGGMFVESLIDSFSISGGSLDIDGTNGGSLQINGDLTTFMSNDLQFSNNSGLILSNGALLNYSGNTIQQENQSSGTTRVTGDGTLFFTGLTELPAHLDIDASIETFFSTGGKSIVNISNGFDSAGDVSLLNTNLNFGMGGNIEGDMLVGSATIQTSPGTSLAVNGTTFVSFESFLRLEDDSTLNGAGSVQVTFGFMGLGSNATVAKDVFVSQGSSIAGDAATSTISGAVEMTNFASADGRLHLTNTLDVTGTDRVFISEGASIEVDGQTTVAGGTLEVGAGALLFGSGAVSVESGATLDLQFGTVAKDILLAEAAMITGTGNIQGTLTVNGLIGPGNSAGTLSIDGNVVMTSTTETCIELGGAAAGHFDLITGTAGFGDGIDTAFLDGNLVVSLIDGFVPTSSDEFSFIQELTIEGTFANTGGSGGFTSLGSLNIGSGVFQVEYGSNFVRLFDFRAIPEPGTGTFLVLLSLATIARRRRS